MGSSIRPKEYMKYFIKEPNGDKKEITNCCNKCKRIIQNAYCTIGDQVFEMQMDFARKCCPDYKFELVDK